MSERADEYITSARTIIELLGLPSGQHNDRSALALLALLDLSPNKLWAEATDPMLGITPMMVWVQKHYGKKYAANTRETFRRQTLHQFCEAGLVILNPDLPSRPVNSPKTVYQVETNLLSLLQNYGNSNWNRELYLYSAKKESLKSRYAMERNTQLVPVNIRPGKIINLSPGDHSQLIRKIIEEFAPRFTPGADLIYAGDTGDKWGYVDSILLENLGVSVDLHGKMPDVVLYFSERNWLILVESVTSHGPVNGKRYGELRKIFNSSVAGLVFVTAFPNRFLMSKFLAEIAWETEVWVADSPTHLIHFNGQRFLGPYNDA